MKNFVFATLLAACSTVSYASTADEIKALLDSGKPAEAYELGQSTPDMLGDPLFDFYFGIAALEAGFPGEGVLALERYVLRYPDNHNARFNLARGYFILGEDQRARTEFEALRSTASPQEAPEIDGFLDAIRARESRYLSTAEAWIEAGVGYDNNLNAGVSSGSLVNIPGLIASPQSPNSISVKTGDGFATLAFGAQGTKPISPGVALFGSASVDSRTYFRSEDDVFDQVSYALNGGISYLSGKDLFRGGLSLGDQSIDSQNYVFIDALTGEWVHQSDQFDRYTLDAAIGHQKFSDLEIFGTLDKTGPQVNSESSLTTNDFVNVAGNWSHVLTMTWNPVIAFTLGYTHEHNLEMRPDYSRDIYTARAQVSATPAPRWTVALGTTYFYDRFLGPYALISTQARHDTNYGIDATVIYRIDRAWSARGEVMWNEETSNIGLFDYSRAAVAAKVRYEFK